MKINYSVGNRTNAGESREEIQSRRYCDGEEWRNKKRKEDFDGL